MRSRRPTTAPTTLPARVAAALALAVLAAGLLALGTRADARRAGEAGTAGSLTAAGAAGAAAEHATAEPTPTTGDAAAADDDAARARARRARVRALQRRLAELDWYRGPVDGLDGPRTDAAVRDFQRAAGLAVDGVPGPATRTALQADDAVTRAAWQARRPDPASARPASSADATRTPATPASAPTAPSSADCDLSCRGKRIVAMSPLPVPSSYDVVVRPARDGYLGMTHGDSRQIVLYVGDEHSDREVGATLLHEIGHAYDFLGLGGRGDAARRRWAQARGFGWDGHDAWFGAGCTGCSDYAIGAGDLAEAVHACWAPGWDRFRSQLAGAPTAAQCDLLARILR